jgi:hypothetical protein
MTRVRLASSERSAFRQFVDAVLALSDDPGMANVERYLDASRALEELRSFRQTPRGAVRLGRRRVEPSAHSSW